MCGKVREFNTNMRVKVGIHSRLLLGTGIPCLGTANKVYVGARGLGTLVHMDYKS